MKANRVPQSDKPDNASRECAGPDKGRAYPLGAWSTIDKKVAEVEGDMEGELHVQSEIPQWR